MVCGNGGNGCSGDGVCGNGYGGNRGCGGDGCCGNGDAVLMDAVGCKATAMHQSLSKVP